MATAVPVDIYAVGIVSALGLSAPRHAALAHARLRGGDIIHLHSSDLDALSGGFVPAAVLPPLHPGITDGFRRPHPHITRLLRLCDNALREATHALATPPPLFLALPVSPSLRQDPYANFLTRLSMQTDQCFDAAQSSLHIGGRSAFFAAMQAAMQCVHATGQSVLVGGVDSFFDPAVIAWLDHHKRLAGGRRKDGVTLGEAAGVLLIGPPARRSDARCADALATVLAAATADEPGHLYSTLPCRGDGLTQALAQVFTQAAPRPAAKTALIGYTGEHFFTKEWGAACIRHRQYLDANLLIQHHVEFYGDVGVAMGPLHMATAALHLRQGHLQGDVLTWAASDTAQRGAALMGQADAATASMSAPTVSKKTSSPALDPIARAAQPKAALAWDAKLADTCLEGAAYVYHIWAKNQRLGLATVISHVQLQRYEARLEALLHAACANPGALPDLRDFIGHDATYSYVCTRMATALQRWDILEACFAMVAWADTRQQHAILHACVHAGASATTQLCTHLAAMPERAATLALWASTQTAAQLGPVTQPRNNRWATYTQLLAGHRAGLERRAQTRDALHSALMPLALAGGPWAYPALIQYATHKPSGMALLALGLFGNMQALPHLMQCLSVPRLERYARRSLLLLTGETDEQGWQAWYSTGARRPHLRYRLGEPCTPRLILATMQHAMLPGLLQYTASIELAMRYKADLTYHPAQQVSAKQAALTAYDAWAVQQAHTIRPGAWYFAGQYDGG